MSPDCAPLGYCPLEQLDEPFGRPSKNNGVENGRQMVVRR